MAEYQMTLSFGSSVIHIPVLPEKLTVKSPGKNETATVLELGEVSLLRRRGLRQVSWESHFPAHDAPYVSAWEGLSPVDYVRDIEDWAGHPGKRTPFHHRHRPQHQHGSGGGGLLL